VAGDPVFSFERARGIVWVCDLESSSKYLNDNASAADLEAFLPRLHWIAMAAVSASGGRFIKWTGDGFLAWFETPLHRDVNARAAALFEALWQLTFTVNVTQLGVATKKTFRLRHGVAFEHDAMLTHIRTGDETAMDVTGRAVVLAFRLSGVPATFPGVTTQADLGAVAEWRTSSISFKSWRPSRDEVLKYFKGERWGTHRLVKSTDKRSPPRSTKGLVRSTKKLIERVEGSGDGPGPESFVARFVSTLERGPAWARQVLATQVAFLRKDILGNLKSAMAMLSEQQDPLGPKRRK
jgi:hypothetical protein